MTIEAQIELKDLKLHTKIGTYHAGDVVPDEHLLNLILWINASLVLIEQDGMDYVFDYDPLVIEINRLAGDCHYETQERLITRVAHACSAYPEIAALEISLRKGPIQNGSGSLGVKLRLDEAALNQLRASNA
jgi:dihydroneopterin aldolase